MGHPTMQENDTAKLTPTSNDSIYFDLSRFSVMFCCIFFAIFEV